MMPHAVRCARFSAGNAYSLPVRAVGIPAGGHGPLSGSRQAGPPGTPKRNLLSLLGPPSSTIALKEETRCPL